MEVFKNIAPMFLAAVFVYTAAVFASIGIKKKGERKIAIIGASAILLVSFTIWVPCFNDLYDVIGLIGKAKTTAMIISLSTILLGCAITTFFYVRKKET